MRFIQPNVIMVFSDQQRWDTCGCYGQTLPVTPNLDRMAAAGVRFEHAFTCQPVCGPARSCLQTGRYASATGCYRNGIALPQNEPTLAHWLGDAGYDTAYVGKWHLATNLHNSFSTEELPPEENYQERAVPPERRGGYHYWMAADILEYTSHAYDGHVFDTDGNQRDFPPGRYRADALGDWAIEYLAGHQRNQPFFLFLSFIEPHHQNDHNRFEGPHGSAEQWGNYAVPGDLVGTKGDWRENYPDYLGCCHAVDANLGRIRSWLAEEGLAENTLLIYTSDHGSHFCTRNSEYKRACHEGCVRVPLVIEGPGFRGGRVVNELVSLLDVPPTMLSAAEVPVASTMQGHALQPLVEGKADDWAREVFIQITEDHIGRAIRTARWKYEVWVPSEHAFSGWACGESDVYHEYHLYDLVNDPFERNNLVTDPAYGEVRRELAQILKRRMVEAGEREPDIMAAALQNN